MSDTEETKKPRRLIHIRAKEVSLVDQAANGKTFAVTKRLEDDEMGERTKIDLDAAKADDEEKEEMEKEAAPAEPSDDVVGDATKAEDEDAEAEGSEEDDAEKGEGLEAAVAELAPWLQAQMESASDEEKALIAAVLEGMGEDEAKAKDDEADAADDAEKADGELAELKAAVAELQAAVKASEGDDEEEAEEDDAEKKVSKADTRYVSKADFDAFKQEIKTTLKDAVSGMATVAKRLKDVESIQPVSKSAEDNVPAETGTSEAAKGIDELFSNILG